MARWETGTSHFKISSINYWGKNWVKQFRLLLVPNEFLVKKIDPKNQIGNNIWVKLLAWKISYKFCVKTNLVPRQIPCAKMSTYKNLSVCDQTKGRCFKNSYLFNFQVGREHVKILINLALSLSLITKMGFDTTTFITNHHELQKGL